MRRVSQRSHSQRGNAALEFGLAFLLLWAIFTGVFQFGYTIYVYSSLMSAVTDGASLASRADFDSTNTTTFTNQVKNMVVYGSPDGGTTPLTPNMTTANVSVAWTTDSAGVPQTITVRITNYGLNAVFKTFVFNKPVVNVKFGGRYLT